MATARQSRAPHGFNIFFVNSRRCGPENAGPPGPFRERRESHLRRYREPRRLSNAAWLDVAKDVAGAAQKHDAMPGRIRAVPFELVVGDFNFGSDIDMRPLTRLVRPVVGNDGVGLAASDADFVRPISSLL